MRYRPISYRRPRLRFTSSGSAVFDPESVAGFVGGGSIAAMRSAGSLWQDTGKTTPAVADNDPVRLMTVAAGVDWTAPSDGERPLLKSEGGGKWSIEGDGTDDFMAAGAAVDVQFVGLRAAYTAATFASFNGLFSGGVTDGANLFLSGDSGQARFFRDLAAVNLYRFNGEDLTAGLTWTAPVGGTPGTCVASKAAAQSVTPQIFKDRANGGRFWGGRLRGFLFYGQVPSAADIALIEAYLGSL